MSDGIKAMHEDEENRRWLRDISIFAQKNPIQILQALQDIDREFREIKFDDMRLTATERYKFERVQKLLRGLLS